MTEPDACADALAPAPLPPDLAFVPAPGSLGRAYRFVPHMPSTMAAAAAWAASGAPHGALVLTDHQTAGRGRHGRAWHDAPGQSLLMTLVLRPPSALPPERLGLLPVAAGLALAEAAAHLLARAPADGRGEAPAGRSAPTVRLKWPNDVLAGGRKLAGVLAEASWSGASRPLVLLGVGVNVARGSVPAALVGQATSLRVCGSEATRGDVLGALLRRLETRLSALGTAAGVEVLRADAERRLAGFGEAVRVAFPQAARAPLMGIVSGLAPDGALVLATSHGPVCVYAGEVTLAAAPLDSSVLRS